MPQSPLEMPIHVFGLTGGIAAGKSTIASHWRKRGLDVIDADRLAREVVAPGSSGLRAVVEMFGRQVLRADGTLDRARVAERVFSDVDARAALESELHPRIGSALANECQALERRGAVLACYEAPLLIETGRAAAFRPLVVVVASESTQIRRMMQRDRYVEADARSRIGAQLSYSEKAAQADLVILNDGPIEQLMAQADSTLTEVCRRLNIDELRLGLV